MEVSRTLPANLRFLRRRGATRSRGSDAARGRRATLQLYSAARAGRCCRWITLVELPLQHSSRKLGPASGGPETRCCSNLPRSLTDGATPRWPRRCWPVGVPPSVIALVQGDSRVAGAAVAADERIAAITFTGFHQGRSRHPRPGASGPHRRVTELQDGLLDPVLDVADDADLDRAAALIVKGASGCPPGLHRHQPCHRDRRGARQSWSKPRSSRAPMPWWSARVAVTAWTWARWPARSN